MSTQNLPLRLLIARNRLTHKSAAQFIGVPVGTLQGWSRGRKMSHSAIRLVAVLIALEAHDPLLFRALLAPHRQPERKRLRNWREYDRAMRRWDKLPNWEKANRAYPADYL